jgi:hypothetical protein
LLAALLALGAGLGFVVVATHQLLRYGRGGRNRDAYRGAGGDFLAG